MKRAVFIILAGVFGVKLNALANMDQAKRLTPIEKAQIALALKILGKTKAVTSTSGQCLEFDPDILGVLEAEGYIQRDSAKPSAICLDVQ